jgi:hypothetical protein
MTNKMKLILATALLAALALPATAEIDVPAMTCGSFAVMDSAGQNTASDALLRWAKASANSSECGTISSQLGCGTSDEMDKSQVRALIAKHCTGQSASANVIEELRKGDF